MCFKWMLVVKQVWLFCVLCLISQVCLAVETVISVDTEQRWFVEYISSVDVQHMTFFRNPNQTRQQRWKPINKGFIIETFGDQERILRKDGKAFSQVKFQLTPSYIHLPKDYAPFTPYSDGGMVLHTGRFFVCPETCEDNPSWSFSLYFPKELNAVVANQVHHDTVHWHEVNDGSKIYVGAAQLEEEHVYINVIDRTLPPQIQSLLDDNLSQVFDYFGSLLPVPNERPVIFAGYKDTPNGSFGQQGGVLPNQIFMYWYGHEALESVNKKDVLFFLAHEIAHFHQGLMQLPIKLYEYWIHEGSADVMAAYFMLSLETDYSDYVEQKWLNAERKCLESVAGKEFLQASIDDTKVHYNCGMLLHRALFKSALRQGKFKGNVFEFWMLFLENIKNAKKNDTATDIYLNTYADLIDSELYKYVSDLLFGRVDSCCTKSTLNKIINKTIQADRLESSASRDNIFQTNTSH